MKTTANQHPLMRHAIIPILVLLVLTMPLRLSAQVATQPSAHTYAAPSATMRSTAPSSYSLHSSSHAAIRSYSSGGMTAAQTPNIIRTNRYSTPAASVSMPITLAPVGALSVRPMATTTDNTYIPRRKTLGGGGEDDEGNQNQNNNDDKPGYNSDPNETPLGNLPLLLMLLLTTAHTLLRRKLKSEK